MFMDKGLEDGIIRIGTKQTLKMIELGKAIKVYVAQDADEYVISNVISLCETKGIPLIYVNTMCELGKACGIEVGAAAAVIIEDE